MTRLLRWIGFERITCGTAIVMIYFGTLRNLRRSVLQEVDVSTVSLLDVANVVEIFPPDVYLQFCHRGFCRFSIHHLASGHISQCF